VILLLALVLCVPAAWAQQKDPRLNPPLALLPPLSGGESTSASASANAAPAAPSESRPLSSAEEWKLGGGEARNYFLPSFTFRQGWDTRPGNRTGGARVSSVSSVGGDFAFHRLSGRKEFTAAYKGGGSFYSSDSNLSSWYQGMEFTQKLLGRRWTVLFGDSLGYAQDRSGGRTSGFGGLSGGLDGQLINPNSGLLPNQSIATTRTARLNNTGFGEWQYQAGRRSTVTMTGSYGFLHFLDSDSGLIDSSNTYVGVGYNYALTGQDTLALSYSASLFRFRDFDQPTDSHTVYLTYGRQLSGRLAFNIGAGPQVTLRSGAAGSDTITSWSLRSSLRYRLPSSSLGFNYSRSVTGGSGLFLGAQTHNVSLSWSRKLSRQWDSTWDFGYSHNETLRQVSVVTNGTTYSTWRGGAHLSRPMGRYVRMSLNYGIERQTSDRSSCVGNTCGLIGIRHVFGVGFNFRFRPIDID